MAKDRALNPEADEAIPLLWGNVLLVFIWIWYSNKKGVKSLILLKKDSIFGINDFSDFPSILKSNVKDLDFLKEIDVWVWQFFKVKLMDGLVGIWTGFFPQYFTKAIFDGLTEVILPDSGSYLSLAKLLLLVHQILP